MDVKLQTVFPYWFKDCLGNGLIKKTSVLVEAKFLATKSYRICQDHVHELSTFLSPDELLDKVKFYIKDKLSDSPNFSRVHLLASKKRNLSNYSS